MLLLKLEGSHCRTLTLNRASTKFGVILLEMRNCMLCFQQSSLLQRSIGLIAQKPSCIEIWRLITMNEIIVHFKGLTHIQCSILMIYGWSIAWNSRALLIKVAESAMNTGSRLQSIKIKSNIIRGILLHLALCAHLLNFSQINATISIARLLLNELAAVFFAWLLSH